MSDDIKNWKRARKRNRHHIKNRCKKGTRAKANIIMMDRNRHAAWHFLFRNLSFVQVAEILLRAEKMKNALQKG